MPTREIMQASSAVSMFTTSLTLFTTLLALARLESTVLVLCQYYMGLIYDIVSFDPNAANAVMWRILLVTL